MITVVFLASIRERLACERLPLDLEQPSLTVTELTERLASRSDHWRQVLLDDKVLVAVNQQMSRGDALVHDGDEVAFFPPVTGG